MHFADTLYDCKLLVKSEEKNVFSDYTKKEAGRLGIGSLYERYFPGEDYNAHRAFGDVVAMEKLFTTTPLVSVLSLSTLTIKTVNCMISRYHDYVREKEATGKLLGELKSDGTDKLAKRLYATGLTYSNVKDMYKESTSYETFSGDLKTAGIKYKAWHEKLFSHFKKSKK